MTRKRLGSGLLLALLLLTGVQMANAWRASELVAPEPTLILLDRHEAFVGEIGTSEADGFGYWRLDELPPRVVAATIAVEDRGFWRHPGISVKSIGRALWQNLSNVERISGASTLPMQVARMQSPGRRTYLRKAQEALTAVFMVQRHGRRAVLAHYLRLVPYGNRIHGIGYAARRYLDKPIADLSWAEVAFLCAIPQAPSHANPYRDSGRQRAQQRASRILALLFSQGLLSADEYVAAKQELQSIAIPERKSRPAQALHATLFLEQELGSPARRQKLGVQPIVHTTLDLDLQTQIHDTVQQHLAQWEALGAGNAAVVVVDRTTFEVVVSVGSTSYFDDRFAGSIDYTRILRYPGSTLKPFLYGIAFDEGLLEPNTIVDDLNRGPQGVGNNDRRYLGPLLPRIALANSRNVPAIDLMSQLGVDHTYDLYRDLGLHDDALPASHYGLGLAIGGMPVRLIDLVQAYTAVATDGRVHALSWLQREPSQPGKRVLSQSSARLVSLYLSDPMARLPSFPRMGFTEYPFAVAVKTGTSPDYRDSWAVAWSQRFLVGVWVGHPDYRPMQRLSGYRAAANLAQQILEPLHRDQLDGLSDLAFAPPKGFQPVSVCSLSGQRATEACSRAVQEWMPVGQETSVCGMHQRQGEPGSEVTTTLLPPRYADWAATEFGVQRGSERVAAMGASTSARLALVSPVQAARYVRDPEVPSDLATLALKVNVDPPAEQVLWLVDEKPFKVVDYPYTTRWPIQGGEHRFRAEIPYTDWRSETVTVLVH